MLFTSPDGIQGVIAMSPALDASGVPAWRRILLRGLANILPKLALKPGLDVTRLTRDQEAQRAFLSDPLLQTKMTLRLASETIAAMAETAELLPHLKPALLVLHGSADVIIPPVAGKRLHDLAGCADKEFRLFEGAFHILSMETNREEVFDCINSWIAWRLTPTPSVGSFRDGPER
jgi:alpha-beta hydrolase superfamily lysophospholipase